jgi:acetyl-CoA C-acetyltransferase
VDPREPVLVGVGQVKHRAADASEACEAAQHMEQALEAALEDTGSAPGVRTALERLTVIRGMWRYPDPGRLVLDAIGAPQATSVLCAMGGNMAQACIIDAAEQIQAGSLDVAAILGAENLYSNRQAKKAGEPFRVRGLDLEPAVPWGSLAGAQSSDFEKSVGMTLPLNIYPIFESVIRASRGESLDEHRSRIGALWARFSEVAANHPLSWLEAPLSAEEIITPTPSNRMIAYPYTKRMVSNPSVDLAAAVVVMAAEKAEALGISRDQWVFLQGAASGNDLYAFSERHRLDRSPAVAKSAERCLELASTSVEEFDIIDLYSCFPSMVQITAAELGLDLEAQLTRTGGMSFFGGPYNSYVMHSVATVVDDVRAAGTKGLVHGNGGNATKQNFVVYGADPAPEGFRHSNVQDEIDHQARNLDHDFAGTATVEGYTVEHGPDGPSHALLTALTDEGNRVLARIDDVGTAAAMEIEEAIGRSVEIESKKGALR